jgi:hypothetical protein
MPQPTLTDSHIDAILTNISVAYMQKQENFIGIGYGIRNLI